MEIDTDKIDDAVLGLLWLTLRDGRRAWKGFDWGALDRLHEKGLIADPANKAKSVVLTKEGLKRAEELLPGCLIRSSAPAWSSVCRRSRKPRSTTCIDSSARSLSFEAPRATRP